MKNCFCCLIFIFLFNYPIVSSAEGLFSVDRSIDCGSFLAKSYSLETFSFFGTNLRKQRIEVISKTTSKSNFIDLKQHFSSNKRLNGLKLLDDHASDWFCLKADTGKRYLWIGFYCGNDDSTSCRNNSERGELYSDTGRNMHLDRLTDTQADALYKHLGIPSALPDGGFISPAHDIIH